MTLHIILFVMGSIAYLMTSTFAINAWFELRRQRKRLERIDDIASGTAQTVIKTFGIVSSVNIQTQLNELQKMQALQQSLVESENYEAAQQLKDHIDQLKDSVQRCVKAVRETFGDQVEIHEVNLKTNEQE